MKTLAPALTLIAFAAFLLAASVATFLHHALAAVGGLGR